MFFMPSWHYCLSVAARKKRQKPPRLSSLNSKPAKALWEKQQAEKNAAIALANQKAAEEKAAVEREQAALEKSSSQRIIFGLSVGALLAFLVGIGLGSSSRKTAGKPVK